MKSTLNRFGAALAFAVVVITAIAVTAGISPEAAPALMATLTPSHMLEVSGGMIGMAYAAAGLRCAVSGLGGGPSIWTYTSADPHTDVDAAGYFSDGVLMGMAVGDIVFVTDSDSAAVDTTVHGVLSVSGDAVTIGAAKLA